MRSPVATERMYPSPAACTCMYKIVNSTDTIATATRTVSLS